MWSTKVLEYCKQILMDDSGWSSEDQMLVGIQFVKARLMRLQLGMRTLLRIGPETMHVIFQQRTYLYFSPILRLWERSYLSAMDP